MSKAAEIGIRNNVSLAVKVIAFVKKIKKGASAILMTVKILMNITQWDVKTIFTHCQ